MPIANLFKKSANKLEWRQDPQLKSVEAKLANLHQHREQIAREVENAKYLYNRAQIDADQAETNHLLGLLDDRGLMTAKQDVEEAQSRLHAAQTLLNDLERQISLLTPALPAVTDTAKEKGLTGYRSAYRAAVQQMVTAMQTVADANEQVREVYEAAHAAYPGWLAGDEKFPRAAGVELLFLEELRPAHAERGALHETELSRWLKRAQHFLERTKE